MSNVDVKIVNKLADKANDIRRLLVTMCNRTGNVHLGGALSVCEVATALYYQFLRPNDVTYFEDPNRDRLILSKGHAGCLIYNILVDKGFYTIDQVCEEYNTVGGRFGMHPNRKYLPQFEFSTGSLGHGMPIATGLALAYRANDTKQRIYCITGDGELQEGTNWEAAMAAAHYRLGNLVAIVDRNKYSVANTTEKTLGIEPLDKKWRSFGWDVRHIDDGNNMEQVAAALSDLPDVGFEENKKPVCLISHTKKGSGFNFMEDNFTYHIAGLDDAQLQDCYCQLDQELKARR